MVKVALFGDSVGVPQLLKAIPREDVACIVGAAIRPQYHDELRALGFPFLIQPKKSSECYPSFASSFPDVDLIVCNSYSMLLRPEILGKARTAINIHGSLLPKNRGNNPTQWAIIRGETETGVTMHTMAATLDSGDIIAQKAVAIGLEDTWVTVNQKLQQATLELIYEQMPLLMDGTYTATPQPESDATSNPRLNVDSPRIDFATMSDLEVYNLIRAQVAPLGGAYIETESGRRHFPDLVPLSEIPALREQASCLV